MVPETIITKLKKLKLESKSSGVFIKEVTDEKTQKNRKHKVVGLLKRFNKLRIHTIKEPSTIAIFHDSPRKDATVESNTEETSNPNVTVHASNVDTNINYVEPISNSLPETTNARVRCENLKMASFGSIRCDIFDKEEKKQQYQAHILGLNAYDRHKKFLKDYVSYYGGEGKKQEKLPIKTDQDTLREGYRFIRSEEDDMDFSWEQRLVKRYYDKLFKEYCIADMSHYKSGKIGLRWRTEKEVTSGKGQFVCGNKHCNEEEGLTSYEVNFAYFEAGENKQALVKLVTCERCAKKLVYKKMKEKEKEESKRRGKEEHKKKRERDENDDDTSKAYERAHGKKLLLTSAGDGKADDEDNFDEFLQGMFP
ncbi:unnamed protein product [Lactuca virosa]|uniref:Protein FRA10AC1 n=1 Tax=Lactuca virosa TaxID=75947 RepID=A0AAU9NRI6_9ASTR|nr:unnamed protein product [Lactuca virosa]